MENNEEKMRIFVIEDNEYMLKAITKKLGHQSQYIINGFSSLEHCLKAIEEHEPDLIISDYYLGEKENSDRLFGEIRKKHLTTPIIMYSSKGDIDMALRLLNLGASDFIIRNENFLEKLNDVIKENWHNLNNISEQQINRTKKIVLALIAFITTSTLIFQYTTPNMLPYYMGILLIVSAIIVFGEKIFRSILFMLHEFK